MHLLNTLDKPVCAKINLDAFNVKKEIEFGGYELKAYRVNDNMLQEIALMDEIKNISLQEYEAVFIINGKINKEINPTIMEAELNMVETKNLSANCKFIIEERNRSSLNCTININPYKDQKSFSFKTSEIITEEYDIYLSKINEISLINERKDGQHQNGDKKDNKLIFILIGIFGFVLISICTIILCVFKKKNKQNEKEKKSLVEIQQFKNQDNSNGTLSNK